MATATLPVVESILHASAQQEVGTTTSIQLYLDSSFRTDREFIDGRLLERNLGEIPHSRLQGFFYWIFRMREADWKLSALTEQRVQVANTRYRVPDVCVVPFHIEDTRIVRTAPLLCIEILSPEDRMSEMQERVDDYLRMGVRTVWVVDPQRRKAFRAEVEGELASVSDVLKVPGTAVEIRVQEVFAELDRYKA